MTSLANTQDDKLIALVPDKKVSVRETFGVDVDMTVPAFSERDAHVPDGGPRARAGRRPIRDEAQAAACSRPMALTMRANTSSSEPTPSTTVSWSCSR